MFTVCKLTFLSSRALIGFILVALQLLEFLWIKHLYPLPLVALTLYNSCKRVIKVLSFMHSSLQGLILSLILSISCSMPAGTIYLSLGHTLVRIGRLFGVL